MKITKNLIQTPLILLLASLAAMSGCGSSDDEDPQDGTASTPAVVAPALQDLTFAFGTDADHPALSNQPGKNRQDTGLVVHAGDQLTIRPSCLVREKREVLIPEVVRMDNPVCVKNTDVCVASEPVMAHQCDDSCHLCVQCSPFPPSCYPWRCCDTVCNDVQVGMRCTRTESRCAETQNQWKETTVFGGLGPATQEKDESPMSESQAIAAGIALTLEPADPATGVAPVKCPLTKYQPKMDTGAIVLTIQDVQGCDPVFAAHANSGAVLGVVNQMGSPLQYQVGTQVKAWDGRILTADEQRTYLPSIEFSGNITIHPQAAPAAAMTAAHP